MIARSIAAPTIFLLFALAACRPNSLPITKLEVVDRSPPPADPSLRIDPEKAEDFARAALDRHIQRLKIRDAVDGEPRHQLTVLLKRTGEEPAHPNDAGVIPKDAVFRGVWVGLELKSLDRKSPIQAHAEVLHGRNAGLFEPIDRILQEAIDRGFALLALEIRLTEADADALTPLLSSPDPSVVERAVNRATDLRDPKTVPALIKIVGQDSTPPAIRMRAIGALVAIRHPSAVGPLVDLTRGKSPEFVTQIVFGVAEIGGKEAEAWLFTVASGHPAPEVKSAAQQAIQELETRKKREPNP